MYLFWGSKRDTSRKSGKDPHTPTARPQQSQTGGVWSYSTINCINQSRIHPKLFSQFLFTTPMWANWIIRAKTADPTHPNAPAKQAGSRTVRKVAIWEVYRIPSSVSYSTISHSPSSSTLISITWPVNHFSRLAENTSTFESEPFLNG